MAVLDTILITIASRPAAARPFVTHHTEGCVKIVVVLLGTALVSVSALGQSAPAARSASADTVISASHLAAAAELLELTNTEQGIRDGIRSYLDAQAQQNPLLAPYRQTMEEFSRKYLVWSDLKPELARIYAKALTEDQLRAAIAFQRTPAGQAFTAHQADVQRAIMQMVQARLNAHSAELQQMIQARAAELNGPNVKKP